jgi:hypothetical protein
MDHPKCAVGDGVVALAQESEFDENTREPLEEKALNEKSLNEKAVLKEKALKEKTVLKEVLKEDRRHSGCCAIQSFRTRSGCCYRKA